MNIEYKIIHAPVPADFYNWYPYIKDENLTDENPLWIKHLNNALTDKQEGMKSLYITARDTDNGRYAGVLWLNYPEKYPAMVHLGWFLTEPDYRGMGIGKKIMDICEQWEKENCIEVMMLPTATDLMAHSNIYLKRGWKDTITEPETGYTFMVKELKEGFYDRYSKISGYEEFDTVKDKDFLPLDYLLNRIGFKSRLYPVNAIYTKRFLSYEQDWDDIETCVLRSGGMLKGIAARNNRLGLENVIDVIAYSCENMYKSLMGALNMWNDCNSFNALIHADDLEKIKVFWDCGFKEIKRVDSFIYANNYVQL